MATKNDKLVLNTIFNPFEPNAGIEEEDYNEQVDSCVCPIEQHQNVENDLTECNLEKLKKLELDGVKLAEQGKLDESLNIFNQVINESPNYASGLNNRAQVHQLKGNVERALMDLQKAIKLVDIKGCKCADKNKVLSQSLCQRALIYRFQNNEASSYADFQKSASLGNEFAKQQVVKLNPYAALCNSMLNQMINKLRNGETESN